VEKKKMIGYRKKPVVFSGETPVAVVHDKEIDLFTYFATRKFGEDEKVELTTEYTQLPIDPIDVEFFGENLIIYRGIYRREKNEHKKTTIGFIYDGEFYMKKLSIRQEVVSDIEDYSPIAHFVRMQDLHSTFEQGILRQEILFSHRELDPIGFFIFRRLQLFVDQEIFNPDILQQVCPLSIQSEATAICTKQGCVGVITKKNLTYIGGVQSYEFCPPDGITGEFYLVPRGYILLEEKIPVSEIRNPYFGEYFPSIESTIKFVNSQEFGAVFGMVLDKTTNSICYPRFFLRKARISCESSLYKFSITVENLTWTLLGSYQRHSIIPQLLRKSDLRFETTEIFTKQFSFPGNWGLRDRSLVLFPGFSYYRIFLFDPVLEVWVTGYESDEFYCTTGIYVCLDPKKEIIEAITDTSGEFIPVDIGKLIATFTYDHFLEDIIDSEIYKNSNKNPIRIRNNSELAKKLLH
jgi:hypothetical protein